jgi:hypothetical protein
MHAMIVQSGGDSDDLIASGLAQAGDISGWSEEDMFTTNERTLLRKVKYDGKSSRVCRRGAESDRSTRVSHSRWRFFEQQPKRW